MVSDETSFLNYSNSKVSNIPQGETKESKRNRQSQNSPSILWTNFGKTKTKNKKIGIHYNIQSADNST